MKINKPKVSKANSSHTTAVVTGVIVTLVLSLLLTGVLSNIILKEKLNENLVSVAVFTIRSISLLIGALIGSTLLKGNYLKLVGFIAGIYLIVLIGVGIIFFDGSFKNFLLGLASVLIGGVGALLILQRPKVSKQKHIKFNL